MHWVIQKKLFKPENYRRLTNALVDLGIEYSSIDIPNNTFNLEPDVDPVGNVYVCGAIKLRKIAEKRNWFPGSFLNDNFNVSKWVEELGHELLNYHAIYGKFGDIKTGNMSKFFKRPLEDNKVFDGMVIDSEMLNTWRRDPAKRGLLKMDVIVTKVQEIYREYRFFIVKNKVITGSVYKVAGKPQVSQDISDAVVNYVSGIVSKWTPAESCVVDVCLTGNGYKVIEFNNINSSGFYAADVVKYVDAIQTEYSSL